MTTVWTLPSSSARPKAETGHYILTRRKKRRRHRLYRNRPARPPPRRLRKRRAAAEEGKARITSVFLSGTPPPIPEAAKRCISARSFTSV